jgi:UDP-hydrolysing UDP-N-acetyl-D-glucosamine 2-epimerase
VRKVCVVVTARPSWAKLQTICEALRAMPDVDLQIVACASALLERYGRVVDVIKAQGFAVAAEVWSVYEGETTLTSAKGTGALLADLGATLQRLRPEVVLLCADRHEVLGAAQAASYMHVCLAHVQGGERSGSIDDKVRDSITALADLHFPCTENAALRVYSLTGSAHIYNTGCSSIDLAKRALLEPPVTADELGGAGAPIDLSQPFLVVLQHGVTSEADQAHAQMWETLHALAGTATPAIVMWPGQDAGAAGISKAIRENQARIGYHTLRSLPPARFLRLLSQASVLVGNSSAGIRECSYLGTPVVNVGTRQWGRERGPNVIDVDHDAVSITDAIKHQVTHGRYPSSGLYGDGNSGQRIAEVLRDVACHRTDPSSVRVQRHTR